MALTTDNVYEPDDNDRTEDTKREDKGVSPLTHEMPQVGEEIDVDGHPGVITNVKANAEGLEVTSMVPIVGEEPPPVVRENRPPSHGNPVDPRAFKHEGVDDDEDTDFEYEEVDDEEDEDER